MIILINISIGLTFSVATTYFFLRPPYFGTDLFIRPTNPIFAIIEIEHGLCLKFQKKICSGMNTQIHIAALSEPRACYNYRPFTWKLVPFIKREMRLNMHNVYPVFHLEKNPGSNLVKVGFQFTKSSFHFRCSYFYRSFK